MQRYLLDLHIHSVLSPCGDILMTPGNIIKEAARQGIDIISITDHNVIGNVKNAIELGKAKNITVIPGIEVQSREDIHLLSYFNNLNDLKKYGKIIYEGLDEIKNDEDKFGPQILVDENDEFIGKEDKLLINSTDYSIEELVNLTHRYKGIPVPSHAERSFGIIKNLGFIPEDLNISFVEMNFQKSVEEYLKKFPYLKKFKLLKNSDSHYLEQISPKMAVYLKKKPTAEAVFSYFKHNKNKEFLLK
jgi:hypothetical protein